MKTLRLLLALAVTVAAAHAQIATQLRATLNKPNPATGDEFGYSVAISGTLMVVGAPFGDTGVPAAGSAYVYDLNSATPTVPVVVLNNPGPGTGGSFGFSVAISGTRVVVGAWSNDEGAEDAGSAYVYDLSSGTPSVPVFTLNNPAPASQDCFGWSVAISGTRVVVGAVYDDAGADSAGSAYIYDLSGGTPSAPVTTLNNPSPAMSDNFGYSVAISGIHVVVGAPADNTGAPDAGSAYLYDLSSGTPTIPVTTLNNPAPAVQDQFGNSVAISGTRIIVGAYLDDAGTTGSGSAYVYDMSSGTPTVPVVTLENPGSALSDQFGSSVALSGTLAVIGAYNDDSEAPNAGIAYVFDLSNGTPTVPVATLNNPDPSHSEFFGGSVAISNMRVVVGAYNDNTGGIRAGSAYVYGLSVPPTAITDPATLITLNSGTLNATITPNGAETAVHFEYGQDANYGNSTSSQAIGSGPAAVAVGANLTGLMPHTTYHFRVTATNSAGTTNGDDATFTTANTMPVANGDTVELPMDHFAVKANDTDGDLDPLTVTSVGAAAHGTATLHGDNTVSYTPDGTFAGTDTFSYTISDGFGGTAIGSVTVQDTIAPVVAEHANVTAEATSAAGATVTYAAGSATDAVGVTSLNYSQNSGTVFPLGMTTVTITARDAANNAGTGTFTVTVVDTTAPVITFSPGPQTVNTGNSPTAALPDVTTLVTATDNVGVASKTQSPTAGTQKAPGTHDVVVTVSDAAGNSAQTTVQVMVVDNGVPVFTTRPPSRSIRAASNETSIVLGNLISEAVAEDNIGVASITQNPVAGTVLEAGDHTVRLTATDAAGNSSVCDVLVTVVPGNKIPVAGADFAFSTAGGVLIDVLENDTDGDGQPLTISAVTQSSSGGVVSIEGNKVRYKPGTGVTTPRTFSYTITDGEDSATATVTIYRFPSPGFTYVGHLFDTDVTTHRGLLFMKVSNAGGTFTGSVFVGAKKYGLKGTFSTDSPTVAIAGASKAFAGIPVLISAGPLDGAGFPQIAFSVAGTAPGTRWRGLAERSPYFRLTTGQLLSPAAGKHTVLFEQAPGSAQPVVAGGCTATVRVPGAARFSGKFGNGAALSTATYLLSGGRAIFYAPAAKGAAYQTLAGTLVFATAADRDVSGDVLWRVPSGFDAKIPGGLARSYPVVGSRYSSSLNRLSPAKSMLDYNATGEATFSFELPSSNRTVDVLRNIANPAIIIGLPPLALVKFTQSSGYYSGSFVDKPVTPGAKFQGWVLQHAAQNRGNGYVLDTNRIGSVSLTPAP